MTRWFVTGAAGLLGSNLMAALDAAGVDAVGHDRQTLDITDRSAVMRVLDEAAPTVVANCAAYTAVDRAESEESLAASVNVTGAANVAQWCAANDARLIHISTDYVFSGEARTPYEVDEPIAPMSAYGRTKAAGEREILSIGGDAHIVRTSWLYGAGGPCFVRRIATLARELDTIDVVDDQRGSPTWAAELARALTTLGTAEVEPGTWHCTGSGNTTWFDFARAIFDELGLDPERVRPATSVRRPKTAPRPAYSVLSNQRWRSAGLPLLTDWRRALGTAFTTLGGQLTGEVPYERR
jgi:dTDP-4-dehydrorhamnose reductase